MGTDAEVLRSRVAELHEFNPMLGHRGVRLAISYPEIAEMQARAIFEAALAAARTTGAAPIPEVMVPLVATKLEFDLVRARIVAVAEQVQAETGEPLEYLVGTMIELPRAALRAGEIAETARVFLLRHQRPDPDHFRHQPRRQRAFSRGLHGQRHFHGRPFRVPRYRRGGRVGEHRRRQRARPARRLKLGICGEHGGDPASIRFCEEAGLDYVSCSPFRVPIARLAAAQAAARAGNDGRTAVLAVPPGAPAAP